MPTDRFKMNLLRKALIAMDERQQEALACFEPLPVQKEFLDSQARIRIISGSNRGTKTTAACVAAARMVTTPHPDGNGIFFVVGKSQKHVSTVLYEKLFKPGLFKIIRDAETNKWRTYKPWLDKDRADLAKPAPPLIPGRLIQDFAWEDKKLLIPNACNLKTGWTIRFYTANGSPPRGVAVDACLAGWSEVYDPVAGKHRTVDQVKEPFHVWSFNEASGSVEVRKASRPFIKGYGSIYRFSLSNGQSIFTTMDHEFLTEAGWKKAREVIADGLSLLRPFALERPAAAIPAEQTPETCRTAAQSELSFSGGTEQQSRRQLACATPSHLSERSYGAGDARSGSLTQDSQGRCSICFRPCGELLPLKDEGSDQDVLPSPDDAHEHSRLSLHWGDLVERSEHTRSHRHESFGMAASVVLRFASPLYRPASSHAQAVAQTRQDPSLSQQLSCCGQRTSAAQLHGQGRGDTASQLPESKCQPHEASEPRTVAKCGSASQATQCRASAQRTACEASLPQETDAGGNGHDHRLSCNSSLSYDLYITDYEEVGEYPIWDISVEETHNYLYGGTVSHNCLLDEEIPGEEWIPEILARLLDRHGILIWSCTPQSATEHLYAFHERALEGDPYVEEFQALLADNPYIDADDKNFLESSLEEEEAAVRIHGDYAIEARKVYPQFDMKKLHGCDPFAVPEDWTRYAVIDPGHQVCAVLFAAVPPPKGKFQRPDGEHGFVNACGDFVYIYDMLYLRQCDAKIFGEQFASKATGHAFEQFIIDFRGARATQAGSGLTIAEHYREELRRHNIRSRRTGTDFYWGSDDRGAGIESVRRWLTIRADGTCKLKIFRNWCKPLETELKRYHHRTVNGVLTDEPYQKRCDATDCLRYLAHMRPAYVPPLAPKEKPANRLEAWMQRIEQKRKNKHKYVYLGPSKGN